MLTQGLAGVYYQIECSLKFSLDERNQMQNNEAIDSKQAPRLEEVIIRLCSLVKVQAGKSNQNRKAEVRSNTKHLRKYHNTQNPPSAQFASVLEDSPPRERLKMTVGLVELFFADWSHASVSEHGYLGLFRAGSDIFTEEVIATSQESGLELILLSARKPDNDNSCAAVQVLWKTEDIFSEPSCGSRYESLLQVAGSSDRITDYFQAFQDLGIAIEFELSCFSRTDCDFVGYTVFRSSDLD